MGIWQNIKDANYSFEKIVLKIFFSFVLIILFYFLIDKLLHLSTEILLFFQSNKIALFAFIIIGVVLFLIHYTLYFSSLDFVEAETIDTVKVAKIFVKIWSLFWICWGVYCAILLSNSYKPTIQLRFIISFLVLIPSLVFPFFSEILRRLEMKEEQANKLLLGDKYNELEPYYSNASRKYYTGYYALLAIPAYLITLLFLFVVE